MEDGSPNLVLIPAAMTRCRYKTAMLHGLTCNKYQIFEG
ncbi:unnamed protein product, partial [Larinioides sclopetarius]